MVTMNVSDDEPLVAAARGLGPAIREAAEEIERQRCLPPALVQQLHAAGLFRMAVPREWGGTEADPVAMTRVVEELATADGSVAWCVLIAWQAAAAPGAHMSPPVGQAIYGADPEVVMAGVVMPGGTATAVRGGYRVSGRWAFASGSSHAAWMGATSIVRDGSVARLDAGGAPVVRMMVVPRHECTVLDTWATTGMRGTASHDFTLEDVFVPEDYALDLAAPPTVANPMYTCPPLLFAPHGSHALGIARAALDAGIALAQGKTPFGGRTRLQDQVTAQGQIGRAEALVEAARTFFYAALADLWASVAAGAGSSAAQRLRLRLACSHAAASAVQAVDLMYALGGGSAIYARSPLERQFRDIHTAAAHMYVNTATFEAAGRVVLGLEAGTRGF